MYVGPAFLPSHKDELSCQCLLHFALYVSLKLVSNSWQGFVVQQLHGRSSKLFWFAVKPFKSVSEQDNSCLFTAAFSAAICETHWPIIIFTSLQLFAGQSIYGPSKYSCESRPNYSVSYPVQSLTDHFLWIINLTPFVFVRNIANNQFNGWIPQEFKSITNLEWVEPFTGVERGSWFSSMQVFVSSFLILCMQFHT